MRACKLRQGWASHRSTVLGFAVALMAIAASIWLGYQFWRLLWGDEPIWPTSPIGARDLKTRLGEVQRWFAGIPIYHEPSCSMDPPATYALLWPLLGWVTFTAARWLWAGTSIAALASLIYLIVQESGADSPLERVFVALIPVSMYATGATIGNGQLIVHVLPALVAGLIVLRRQPSWPGDLLAAVLVLISLVKPNVAAPFFWIVLLVPGRLRPALLVGIGYGALTLLAVSFQEAGPGVLLREWLARASRMAVSAGESNVHVWLASIGLSAWIGPASAFALLALGGWVWQHRRADTWVTIGTAAVVARFWTYHRWYDDLLLLLPMTALFRIAKQGRTAAGGDAAAGILLAVTMLTTLAPGGLYVLPPSCKHMFVAAQVLVWLTVLGFLLDRARRDGLSEGSGCELTCQ